VLAGRLSLTELAALVSEARLVVCGDTGVAHLASAYRTASVVLFGPVSPALWGPPTSGPHVALWHGTAPGDPWGDVVDPSLVLISPTEVIEAAHRLLRQDEMPGGQGPAVGLHDGRGQTAARRR
jgi:ADP-heptose:LPS heptosyltransferase